MSEILLCSHAMSPAALQNEHGVKMEELSTVSCHKPTIALANTPYLMMSERSCINEKTLNQLSPPSIAEELTNLSLSFGEDNVLAIAEITAKLENYNIGLLGASTSVYANRIGGFAGSVKNYQSALMEYRQAVVSNSAFKNVAKQKAFAAFQKMQSQFHNEIDVVTAQIKARRGTPLTSVKRATNIARSSRNVAKLNITSQVQAENLVKLSKHAKFLGNGLAVIDFGTRVGNIHNSYEGGDNWEREMFIESSSFATSAIAGTAVVNAGIVALELLMIATPVGWVGLIIGGAAVAGTAAVASIAMNNAVKSNSGDWYDSIMNWLGMK